MRALTTFGLVLVLAASAGYVLAPGEPVRSPRAVAPIRVSSSPTRAPPLVERPRPRAKAEERRPCELEVGRGAERLALRIRSTSSRPVESYRLALGLAGGEPLVAEDEERPRGPDLDLRGLEPGLYIITVRSGALAARVEVPVPGEARVLLEPSGTIRGRARPGVLVRAVDPELGIALASGRCTLDGGFTLSDLPAGFFEVRADAHPVSIMTPLLPGGTAEVVLGD